MMPEDLVTVAAWMLGVLLFVVSAFSALRTGRTTTRKEPPWLRDTIPFVSNTWQYLTDMQGFLDRAR